MKMLCVFLCFSFSAFASSVRLYNDSPYPLIAVVQAADGKKMGEVLIQPNQLMVWSDNSGMTGYQEPSRSETPFSVLWYCSEGTPYSVTPQVGNAGMVTAQTSQGDRQCKVKPPPPLQPGENNQLPQTQFYEQPPIQPPSAPSSAP
ncbi:MAG: hypothetical protein V4494_07805 [Chlamydiota bacterium]